MLFFMWFMFLFSVVAVIRELFSICVAWYLQRQGGLSSFVRYKPNWFSVASVVVLAGTTGYLFF